MNVGKICVTAIMAILVWCGTPQAATGIQAGTYDSLYAGVYEGITPIAPLLTKKSIGLGTFDGLDGEMIIVDGGIFQVKGDGTVIRPPAIITTPFITIADFSAQFTAPVPAGNNFEQLGRAIDTLVPELNIPLAIRIHGTFSYVRTRSFPKQRRPYKLLTEIIRTQPEFTAQDVTGTLVGFRYPEYLRGINAIGYHLHFISDDATFGGHVLELKTTSGTINVEKLTEVRIILPETDKTFLNTSFPLVHDQ